MRAAGPRSGPSRPAGHPPEREAVTACGRLTRTRDRLAPPAAAGTGGETGAAVADRNGVDLQAVYIYDNMAGRPERPSLIGAGRRARAVRHDSRCAASRYDHAEDLRNGEEKTGAKRS